MKTTSLRCFLLVARGSHSRSAKSLVVLVVLSVMLMLQGVRAARLCIASMSFSYDLPRRSHAADAYSSVGRIICLYAIALISCDEVCTFRLRSPSLDEAFPVIEATCCLNVRPSSTSTPKYFVCFVLGMVVLWMVNGCSVGVRFLENRICSHFVALNDISHFCSQFSSIVRSSWRASMFAELL